MFTNFHIVADSVNAKVGTDITDLFVNSFQERLVTKKHASRFSL